MSFNGSLKEVLDINAPQHAYLILGERERTISELCSMFEDAGVSIKGNPDFHIYEHDAFLIEHAHNLREEQSMHASSGSRKIFVVAFNTIMSEAQNALLKTLEEPTAGTKFFFITRTAETLLPTVRSRMQTIKPEGKFEGESNESREGGSFLEAGIPERLKMIERYTKVKADDKSRAKEDARVFLETLERAMYAKNDPNYSNSLQNIITAKKYLSDRAPSVKLLLEHLALTIPFKAN